MLQKILIVIIIAMSILGCFAVYKKTKDVRPDSLLKKKDEQIKKSPIKSEVVPTIVQEINSRNKQINSFSCDDVEIKLWQAGHRFRLTGKIHYEKPQRFRMEISSVLAKEMDMGSNDEAFWYWSKRDKRPGLYWARHEDFGKTRLKAPFNPNFMKASLGLDLISQDFKLVENLTDMMFVFSRSNGSGQPILYSLFVNKERKQIDGFLVTDPSGKHLAACEIQQRNGDLPTKILYTWYEEDRVMLIQLNNPQANTQIDGIHWTMPNYTPKIDMSEQ